MTVGMRPIPRRPRSAKPLQLLVARSRPRGGSDPGWRQDLAEARRLSASLGPAASLPSVLREAERRWARISRSPDRAAQAMGFYLWASEARDYLSRQPRERRAHRLHQAVRGLPGLRLG